MSKLEEDQARVKALVEALIAGEQLGESTLFDNQAFLKRMRERYSR